VNNHREGGEPDNRPNGVEKETDRRGRARSAPEDKWQHTDKDKGCENVHASEDRVCFEKRIEPQQVPGNVRAEWPPQGKSATKYDSDADNDA
jgi:hypothetical protein